MRRTEHDGDLVLDEHDERTWKRSQRTDLDGQLRRKWNSPPTRLRQGETLGMPTALGPRDCWRRQSDLHEGGLNNPADALTHYWTYEDGKRHFEKLNLFKNPTLNQTSGEPLV